MVAVVAAGEGAAVAMTLTTYAARRGCSVKSVSRAIAAGRLVQCVGRDDRGRPTIADPDLADREWDANTQRRPEYTSTRQGTPDQQSGDGTPGQPVAWAGANPAPDTTGRPRPPLADDTPAGVPSLNASRAVRAHALARRDTAHADLAELELAAKRGRLVDADAARADVEQAYSLVKTRLLRVPSDLAQRLPHLASEVVPVLEELQRAALEELAR